MANTFLTPSIIAKEALMVLESQMAMAGLVHRDYSNEFVNVGDTITVRKPAKFIAKNFTGATEDQDATEGSVDVKMDRFRDVTIPITSKELTLDIKSFSEQIVEPAMMAMAQAIDIDLLTVGVEKAGNTATVSGTPVIGDIANISKALDIKKVPRTMRNLVMPPDILYKYNTLDNLTKLSYSGDSKALREAEVGRIYTMDTFMSQNCPENASATAGTATAYKVVGTKGTTQFTVSSGTAATATIKTGDKLIVNGYLYTCIEDLTLVAGGGTLKVDQKIPATILAATDATLIKKAHGLGFYRNGLALVTRNLALPMGNSNSYIASANGIGVRVVMDYDSSSKTDRISFDTIYGIKELDSDMIVDFS